MIPESRLVGSARPPAAKLTAPRRNPDIVARLRSFAYNLMRAGGCDNIKNARWRAAIDSDATVKIRSISC